MDKQTLGAVVLMAGIAILMVFLFADGLGIGNLSGFGSYQAVGTTVGAVVTAVGLFLMVKAK